MAWDSDFSDAIFYIQYFRNPGTGTPAILVYTQIHRFFVASHSTVHNRSRVASFTDTTFAKRELAVNTLCKVKSVKTTLSSTRSVHIAKLNQDLV
jgi:hypothetical protein